MEQHYLLLLIWKINKPLPTNQKAAFNRANLHKLHLADFYTQLGSEHQHVLLCKL